MRLYLVSAVGLVGGLIRAQQLELHGGRIWVESEGAGHSSTFCFTLGRLRHGEEPAARPQSEAAAEGLREPAFPLS